MLKICFNFEFLNVNVYKNDFTFYFKAKRPYKSFFNKINHEA